MFTQRGQINKQAHRLLTQRYPRLYETVCNLTSFLDYDAPVRDRLFCILNCIEVQPTCPSCGRTMRFNQQKNRFNQYCPNTTDGSCGMSDPTKRTQIKDTTIKRHGVDNAQKSPAVKVKRASTMIHRYGVVSPAQMEQNRNKLRDYIVANAAEVEDKRVATSLSKYNRTHANQRHIPDEAYAVLSSKANLESALRDLSKTDLAMSLGVTFNLVHEACKRFDLEYIPTKSAGSSQQQSLLTYVLQQYNGEIVQDAKGIIPAYELDIYLPGLKLAIEYNGVYFHGESNNRGRTYHRNKLNLCNEAGVRLIQVWSNEWLYKRDVVKSRISSALGRSERLYARHCQFVTLTPQQEREFFSNSHMQGYVPSAVNIGLQHNGATVAVMSFIRSRYNKNFEWELLRYSSAPYRTVVGGASKLLKRFITEHSPSSMISYCDLRWGSGNMYEQIGFTRASRSAPNYFYFNRNGDTNKLQSRQMFQKHKLKDVLETFNPALTEWENMRANGYDRIWDCGNDVFTLACQ